MNKKKKKPQQKRHNILLEKEYFITFNYDCYSIL